MDSRKTNEVLGLTLAILSSFNESQKFNKLIEEIESSILRSERWTTSRVYALESFGVAQLCISTFYVSRQMQLDECTALKLIDSIIGRIIKAKQPAGFGSQQMYNTLPCLFAAAGIFANHKNYKKPERFLAKMHSLLLLNQNKNQDSRRHSNSISSFSSMLDSSEFVICASTVSDPDNYVRSLSSKTSIKPVLTVNNINGYWGNIDETRKYVSNIYCIDVWHLYYKLNIYITKYMRDNIFFLISNLDKLRIENSASIWEHFFYELICYIESILPNPCKEVPGQLVIPDHSLIELLPIVRNFDNLFAREQTRCKLVIAKHAKSIHKNTLWEHKLSSLNTLYLDYSAGYSQLPAEIKIIEGEKLMSPSKQRLSSKPCHSQFILLTSKNISTSSSHVFNNCIVVTNGAFHSESNYFSLYDSVEGVAQRISEAIKLCRDLFLCKDFTLRARPGMNLQAKKLHRQIISISNINLGLADTQQPFKEAVASFDLVVVYYPTTALYEAIDSGKSVVAIFRSTREAMKFTNNSKRTRIRQKLLA